MNDLGCIQHSPEWYAARIGMVTSSKVSAAIAKRKRGEGDLAERRKLKTQMLAEILSERTMDHYVSLAMDWGIEQEPRARAEYELKTGYSVDPVGLVLHPTMSRAAASPDGFVAPDGLLEIKCPETWTHIEYLTQEIVPAEYIPQMMWQMACAGPEIQWNDFVSYDPRLHEDLQLLIVRLPRDDKLIAAMEAEVEQFLFELAELADKIKHRDGWTERKLKESIALVKSRKDHDLGITDADTHSHQEIFQGDLD